MFEMIRDLKETYDLEDCKYILEGGCVSGCAYKHIYYAQTNSFYDKYDDEVVEYVKEAMGDNYPACLFVENDYDIILYKNSIVWCAIETYAFEQCDEELMKERLQWSSY